MQRRHSAALLLRVVFLEKWTVDGLFPLQTSDESKQGKAR
jgi:hypothetical protein